MSTAPTPVPTPETLDAGAEIARLKLELSRAEWERLCISPEQDCAVVRVLEQLRAGTGFCSCGAEACQVESALREIFRVLRLVR